MNRSRQAQRPAAPRPPAAWLCVSLAAGLAVRHGGPALAPAAARAPAASGLVPPRGPRRHDQLAPRRCPARSAVLPGHSWVRTVFRGPRGHANVLFEGVDQSVAAAGWMFNQRTPAALVAGSALSSLFSLHDVLRVKRADGRRTRLTKKVITLLLIFAFALELVTIGVTTVTGTMLLGNADCLLPEEMVNPLARTPIGMLSRELEFEYLVARCGFWTGLIFWLSAMSLRFTLPRYTVPWQQLNRRRRAQRRVDFVCCGSLVMAVLFLMQFFNGHLSFYANYAEMLGRVVWLGFTKYYAQWPPKFLPYFGLIPIAWLSVQVFKLLEYGAEGEEAEEAVSSEDLPDEERGQPDEPGRLSTIAASEETETTPAEGEAPEVPPASELEGGLPPAAATDKT